MSADQPPRDFEDLKAMIARAEADGARDEAIGELISAFGGHVRRLARQLIDRRLRQLLGSEDVLQSVCLKLLSGLRAGDVELRSEAEFVKLLKVMTQNVASDKHAFHAARKRQYTRTQRITAAAAPGEPAAEIPVADPRTPTPSVDVRGLERQEILQQLYARVEALLQADEWYIYRRRYIDGAELAEIGREWGASPDAIRMRLKRINEGLRGKLVEFAEFLDRDA